MAKRIPIARAKEIAQRHGLDQVILVAWEAKSGTTHVVTYGTTLRHSEQAAVGGNRVKKALGWPASLDAEPSRVTALRREAAELRLEVRRLARELNEIRAAAGALTGEAAASVALDHGEIGTHSVDDGCPGGHRG